MVRNRVRIRFCKQGERRWIGHRDLVRTLERWFRRAGLRLSMTEGFHPRPRMSFPSALPLGVEGAEEVMELQLAEHRPAEELRACLERCAPPGLAIRHIDLLEEGTKKSQMIRTEYTLPIPTERRAALRRRITDVVATTSLRIRRGEERTSIDLGFQLDRLELVDGVLHIGLKACHERGLRARDVIVALGLGDVEQQRAHLTRTRVELDA